MFIFHHQMPLVYCEYAIISNSYHKCQIQNTYMLSSNNYGQYMQSNTLIYVEFCSISSGIPNVLN